MLYRYCWRAHRLYFTAERQRCILGSGLPLLNSASNSFQRNYYNPSPANVKDRGRRGVVAGPKGQSSLTECAAQMVEKRSSINSELFSRKTGVRWFSSFSSPCSNGNRAHGLNSCSRSPLKCSSLACHVSKASFFSSVVPEKRKEFVERRIMGYSMEQMFAVVSDVENYNKFLPWCESSVVKSRRRDHVLADLVIGMKPVTESYTSSVILTKPHLIRAESTNGRYFNNMLTYWKFNPGLKGKPQTCIIDFYVSLQFRSAIHANIANVFFNEVVKAMAGAFYEEAKRRYGPESVPSRKIAIVSKSDNDL